MLRKRNVSVFKVVKVLHLVSAIRYNALQFTLFRLKLVQWERLYQFWNWDLTQSRKMLCRWASLWGRIYAVHHGSDVSAADFRPQVKMSAERWFGLSITLALEVFRPYRVLFAINFAGIFDQDLLFEKWTVKSVDNIKSCWNTNLSDKFLINFR